MAATSKEPEFDTALLPDLLPLYYKRLFPHIPFYRWLSYGLCMMNPILGFI